MANTKYVGFRIPIETHEEFRGKAEEAHITLTDFFKEAIIENKTVVVAKPPKTMNEKRLMYLVSKASNNLNQIAYRANRDHRAGILSEQTYRYLLSELKATNIMLKQEILDADQSPGGERGDS